MTIAFDPRGIDRPFRRRRETPRHWIDRDPSRHESERFRRADRAAISVVYLLAIETQAGDAKVHRLIIAAPERSAGTRAKVAGAQAGYNVRSCPEGSPLRKWRNWQTR